MLSKKLEEFLYHKKDMHPDDAADLFVHELFDLLDQEEPKPTIDADYNLLKEVNNDVWLELGKQRRKWGVQRHTNERWLAIAIEEVGEAAQAIQEGSKAHKETDADDLYTEVVQGAAVLMSWAAQELERRKAAKT